MSLLKHTKAGKHRAVTLYLLSTHRCHLIWDSYSLKGSICRVQNGAEFRNEPIFSVKNRGYRLQICVAGIEPQHPLCLSVLQAEFLPALSREHEFLRILPCCSQDHAHWDKDSNNAGPVRAPTLTWTCKELKWTHFYSTLLINVLQAT